MIIAIIPAPGHEALVAAGDREPNHPAVRVERPMTIGRCKCGAYACRSHYLDGHGHSDGPVALVLHAPGGPKLGMLRAMEAASRIVGFRIGYAAETSPGIVGLYPADISREPYCVAVDVGLPLDVPDAALLPLGVAHLLVRAGVGMSVYVDRMRAPFGRMVMCHMLADTTDELLAMADTIGVDRRRIQHAGTPKEHFDIALTKRAAAIKAGAIDASAADVAALLRRKRAAVPGSV